ncbi:Protein transport protein S9 plasma membrane t-SNARE [Tieghemiomyces parasiticus]|uniref:Protein transport protein S9 plasma membrane t-SNARE n=1 Tax=Tieghemiomyces parasiticus TaxID=78921 RepID=A0A9W8E272_9FUNG|nr:Protein transport protein S9 plasma membrane t-SNARE [Tieghemiomyces parasiticus]
MDDYRRYRNQTAGGQSAQENPWQPRAGYTPPGQRGQPSAPNGGGYGSSGYGSTSGPGGYNSTGSYGPTSGPGSRNPGGAYGSPASSQYCEPGAPVDEEQQQYDYARNNIRSMREDTLASSRNALQTLRQTEQVGATTLNTVGNQTLQLNSTERQLNLADLQTDVSLDKTGELKNLNRNFLIPNFKNPFGRTKRRERELAEAKENHQRMLDGKEDRVRVDAQDRHRLQKAGWTGPPGDQDAAKDKKSGRSTPGSSSANSSAFGSPAPGQSAYGGGGGYSSRTQGMTMEDRQRYLLKNEYGEEDETERNQEEEIHQNTNEMLGAISNLKRMGQSMNSELTIQNRRLDDMAGKSDKVSGKIFTSQYRVDSM